MKVANKLRWVVGEIDPTGFGLYSTSVPPGVIVQKFQTQSLSGISEKFLQEVTALHSKYIHLHFVLLIVKLEVLHLE